MQKRLLSFVFFTCTILSFNLQANSSPSLGGEDNPSSLSFDLEACQSNSGVPGSSSDYSEFTASIDNTSDCATISLDGNNLYRLNPDVNAHSCSPGVDNSIAMCVGISESCEYVPNDERAVRFDVVVNPTGTEPATLTELSFFENAPEEFDWIDGPTGPNNYPTKYAIRVSANNEVLYEESEISTENEWNQERYSFAEIEGFTVNESTIFNFELVPYCAVGNGASVAAWDLDNIVVLAGCVPVEGGTIELPGGETEIEICVGDGLSDSFEVLLENELGDSSTWLITDSDLSILGLPDAPPFDLEGAGGGVCLIWHLSYNGDITGLEVGESALDLTGCYDLSNQITVTRNAVNGGELSTENGETEINICAGDGISDEFDINLIGEEGQNMAWVITDDGGTILALPESAPFDLEGAGNGTCLLWNLAYMDGLEGVEIGLNAAEFLGCFDLSNPITIVREGVNGGELSTTDGSIELSICAGDGISDEFDIELTNAEGQNMAWIITNEDGKILGLPEAPPFDLEGAGEGICLLWNLAYSDGLSGIEIDSNANNFEGCYDLSNPITIIREGVNGGELSTIDGQTELSICVGDGVSDAFDVTLNGNNGQNMAWIITDENGNILALPTAPPFDLEGAGEGTCLIWNLSYSDGLEGLELDQNTSEFEGCHALSNPIIVHRGEATGGNLSLENGDTEIEICVGDGINDPLDVVLSDETGMNLSWLITDQDGNILGLPDAPPFDLEGAGAGTCLIWNVSYVDGLVGIEIDSNTNNFQGCYSLSNPITVNRTEVAGGELTTSDGETNIIICADDGESDAFEVNLENAIGSNMGWVITDNLGVILDLPSAPPFDLEGSGAGVCLLWNVSFEDGLEGLEIGEIAENLIGCHDLSNPITVTRLVGDNCDLLLCDAEGGAISLEDGSTSISICADDQMDDLISPILDGNIGTNTQWVITDTDANILALPDALPINFEGAGAGICLIWSLSYEDGLTGLEVDNNIASLTGCYDLSNAIVVTRLEGEDCEGLNCDVDGGAITLDNGETSITICVGDSIPDPLDVILAGNIGMNSEWVISSINGTILGLADTPPFDLDDAGVGICLIWHISYDGELEGLEVDSNSNDLSGCFDLSNPIVVTRVTGAACDNIGCEAEGGNIATTDGLTEIEICVGDGISDAFDVVLDNNSGTNSQWVVTNASAIIIALPDGPPFDFEDAGPGVCIIWHLSYEDGISGLAIDSSALNLDGCFDLSNSITVTRYEGANCQMIDCEANGGIVTYPDGSVVFQVCAGDGIDDITDVNLSGNSGTNSTWIISSNSGEILDLNQVPPFNFETASGGICLIWHMSYEDGIEGNEIGENINDIAGCFSLSNSLTVIRNEVDGGDLVFSDGTISTEICVGDGIPDSIDVNLTNALGDSMQWVITDPTGQIIALPDTFPIDFEGVDAGVCLIWNLSYTGSINGLEVDSNTNNILGCYNFSNFIELTRVTGADCDGGLKGDQDDLLFSFGPNPTTGMLEVYFEKLPSNEATVKIINSTGQLVRDKKSENSSKVTLDISEVNDGLYFILVESSARIKVKKLLKIK